ncbi:hypothetical protein WAH66_20835, partial [Acinetobacter baumannii]
KVCVLSFGKLASIANLRTTFDQDHRVKPSALFLDELDKNNCPLAWLNFLRSSNQEIYNSPVTTE